jgi:hypothetical protein
MSSKKDLIDKRFLEKTKEDLSKQQALLNQQISKARQEIQNMVTQVIHVSGKLSQINALLETLNRGA